VLESAKEMAGDFRDKAVAGAKATDKAINENPNMSVAIAPGVVSLGWICNRSKIQQERIN
jgi:ElaB/YqjD/DUF883 family membrane-anchored ribosome-binding protein